MLIYQLCMKYHLQHWQEFLCEGHSAFAEPEQWTVPSFQFWTLGMLQRQQSFQKGVHILYKCLFKDPLDNSIDLGTKVFLAQISSRNYSYCNHTCSVSMTVIKPYFIIILTLDYSILLLLYYIISDFSVYLCLFVCFIYLNTCSFPVWFFACR